MVDNEKRDSDRFYPTFWESVKKNIQKHTPSYSLPNIKKFKNVLPDK